MTALVPESQQQYGSILTIAGENAEANSKVLKLPVEITHIAFGDANDEYVQPDRNATALVNEIDRIPVNAVDVLQATPESVPMVRVEALLPPELGNLVIREFAAVANFNGNQLFHAVGNCARIYVPEPINNGNMANPVILEMFYVNTSGEAIVEIDPRVVHASRDYVNTQVSKSDDRVAQTIIDQNGKDWFIEDGFLVTPSGSAYSIKAGAGYVSGNRVTLEFDRSVSIPNKPSFIYVDAHREGTPTGEQVTLFDFVITADEKDDYTDANGVKHFVCKIAQVLADGSVSDLRPEGERAIREKVAGIPWKIGDIAQANKPYAFTDYDGEKITLYTSENDIRMTTRPAVGAWKTADGFSVLPAVGDSVDGLLRLKFSGNNLFAWGDPAGRLKEIVRASDSRYIVNTDNGEFEFLSESKLNERGKGIDGLNVYSLSVSGFGGDLQKTVAERNGATIHYPFSDIGYYESNEIKVPVGHEIIGEGALTRLTFGPGTFPNGYALLMNTDDGVNATKPYANFSTGKIESFKFESKVKGLKAIVFSGSPEFRTLVFKDFKQAIVGTQQYNDQVTIKRVICYQSTVDHDYQIDLKNLGDSVEIDQLHCPNIYNSPLTPQKSLRLTGNRAEVTRSLLGDVYLNTVLGSSVFSGCSMDGGKFYLWKSHVSIKDTGVSAHPTEAVFDIMNTEVHNYKVSLENILVSHDIYRNLYAPYVYDVKISNNTQVELRNVSRNIIYSPAPDSKQQLGVLIEKENGAAFEEFNSLSHFYSSNCLISDEKIIKGDVSIEIPNEPLFYFQSIGNYGLADWDSEAGTYFYIVQPLWDLKRLAGRKDEFGERSISVDVGGKSVGLNIGSSLYPRPFTLRIYRGVKTGVYDKVVEIPIVSASVLVDQGSTLSGAPWLERQAGPADEFNSFACRGFAISSGNVEIKADKPPTVGYWKKGDVIINNPASAAPEKWTCKETGNPGDWLEL